MIEITQNARIPRLQGSENYELWVLRISSILATKTLSAPLNVTDSDKTVIPADTESRYLAEIRLSLGDGPLIQVSTQKTAITT